ncbi:MAG: MG2 domain-containing protein, partial [Dehalococcoidia bacterium]|nr:MG2 domain-containing protein [Dehalococcoidia bacterium]
MSDKERFDRLDKSLDDVIAGGRVSPTGDAEVDRLARFAPDLMDLPDPAFRERLRAELFPQARFIHRLRTWLTGGRRPQLLASGLTLAVLVAVVAGLYFATAGQSPVSAEVDGYVALVPRVLRAGETESVSLSLFDGDRLARGDVQVAFRSKGKTVLETSADIKGKGTIQLQVPPDARGDYEIVVNGPGFTDTARVQVQQGTLLFLETDKPIYKPGQTILMRLVALNSELKPVPAQATVEVQDAKAIKVFKQAATTDEFGMATLELPLSAEPNLGIWKVSARAGDTSTEVDVRVEEYVLPKYEVKVELPQQWFLVNEPISGHVTAQYSFGKPVRGELQVKASRYVGVWEEFATFTAALDGEADFQIKPAGFLAGVPEAGGQGNVTLDVTVVERATGYEEKTSELVTVAASPVNVQIIPESPVFKPSLPFNLLLVTETPDGQPVEAAVNVEVAYLDQNYAEVGREQQRVETKRGTALVALTPPAAGAVTMSVNATSGDAYAFKEVAAGYSPSGNFIHVEQVEPTLLRVGDKAGFRVSSTSEARHFYYEVVSRDRVVFTGSTDSPDIAFTVTPAMAPSAKLLVYQVLPTSEVAADFIPFDAEGDYPHKVTASFSAEEARPGDDLQVNVQTEGPARVGLVAVDRSVYILAENRLNLQQVFAELERLYMQPQAELHEAEAPPGPIVIQGAQETFQDAGLIVLSDKRVPKGKQIERPVFFEDFGGIRADGDAAQERPAAGPATGAPLGSAPTKSLAEVQRIRQFFPETWIWDEVTTDGEGRASLPVQAPDT